ncbi:MAG: lipocalin family protein [Burkholderiales bacterium]
MLRAALTALVLAVPLAVVAQPTLPTVPALDLDRYVGRWHEVARYPNSFERDCARDVTATYTRNADGTIQVINDCRRTDGSLLRAEGLARMGEPPSKLEVRFAPAWLSWLPLVWANYWVIDLADDYSYAVVGEPSRDYLWILARDPRLPDATYARIVAKLPALGYEPDRLLRNQQP